MYIALLTITAWVVPGNNHTRYFYYRPTLLRSYPSASQGWCCADIRLNSWQLSVRCLLTYSMELKCKTCPSAGRWRRRTYTARLQLVREYPPELGADYLLLSLRSGTEPAGSTWYLGSTKRFLEMNWVLWKNIETQLRLKEDDAKPRFSRLATFH